MAVNRAVFAVGAVDWATAHLLNNDHEAVADAYRAMTPGARSKMLGGWFAGERTARFLQCSQHSPLLHAILDDVARPAFSTITWPHWMIEVAMVHDRTADIEHIARRLGPIPAGPVGEVDTRALLGWRVLRSAIEQSKGDPEHDKRLARAALAMAADPGAFLKEPQSMMLIGATTPLSFLQRLDEQAGHGDGAEWKTLVMEQVAGSLMIAPPSTAKQRIGAIAVMEWAYSTGPQCLPDGIVKCMFDCLCLYARDANLLVDWVIEKLVRRPSPKDAARNLWHEFACGGASGSDHWLTNMLPDSPSFVERLPVLMRHDILAPAMRGSSRVAGMEEGTCIDQHLAKHAISGCQWLETLIADARARVMHSQTAAIESQRSAPRF